MTFHGVRRLGYRVRCKLWVESEQRVAITPARVALVRQVLGHPSISEAARSLGIPYKKAHRLVTSLDERLGGGLISRKSGGPQGGFTVVHAGGTTLLADYERLCTRVFEALSTATFLGAPVEVEVSGATRKEASPAPAGPPATEAEADRELYTRARVVAGHSCPGMVLGVRMAAAAMGDLGLVPLERHRDLRVTVETARCAADAIQAVSGTSPGRSSFSIEEHGKMAATFSIAGQESAVRVVALESSRQAADALFPDMKGKKERQIRAYKVLPEAALVRKGRVRLLDRPAGAGRASHQRAACPKCGEAFEPAFGSFKGAELYCRSCAGRPYFEPFAPPPAARG